MTKKTISTSLKEKLMRADHEKLVDLLLQFHAQHKDVKKTLELMFSDTFEPDQQVLLLIKKELRSLKYKKSYVDYYGSNGLANQLDELRLKILNHLTLYPSQVAFDMMLKFLDLHDNTLHRVDDSNGAVGSVFCEACEDLGKLAQRLPRVTYREIVELVFLRFTTDQFGIYDDIILHFKETLKEEGLNLLQEKFHQSAGELKQFTIKHALQSIADCKEDVDQFILACSWGGEPPNDHECIEISTRLMKKKCAEEALKWLCKHEVKNPQNSDRKKLKIQAFEQLGLHEQAQNERISLFLINLSPEEYQEILKHGDQAFQEAFKVQAISHAFHHALPYAALEFLISEKMFQEAEQFILLKHNTLHGSHYYTLRAAAKVLQKEAPLAATLLYRMMVDANVEAAQSQYYHYAAKDLVVCDSMKIQVTDWQGHPTHEEYFILFCEKHKRKYRFWRDYKQALEKQAGKSKGGPMTAQ